jgi:hypothetical protein
VQEVRAANRYGDRPWRLEEAELDCRFMVANIPGNKAAAIIARPFACQMNQVEGVIPKGDLFIVDDHLDRPILRLLLHRGDVGGPLFHCAEETSVIGPGCKITTLVPVGTSLSITPQHGSSGVEGNAGIDNFGIDPLGFQQGL